MIQNNFDLMMTASHIIIFGGTFDPIHNGHLAIADTLYAKVGTTIIFLPTGIPPYKAAPLASNLERLEMLKLALGTDPRYALNTFEIKQDEYWPSYKTLTLMRNKLGARVPIFFLIGGDSLVTLDTWDYWQKLFELTNFVVVMRPDYKLDSMAYELRNEFDSRKTTDFSNLTVPHGKIYLLDFPPCDISSTKIRGRIKMSLSIDNFVPHTVATYINQHNIYRTKNGLETNHTNCN